MGPEKAEGKLAWPVSDAFGPQGEWSGSTEASDGCSGVNLVEDVGIEGVVKAVAAGRDEFPTDGESPRDEATGDSGDGFCKSLSTIWVRSPW